MLHFRSLYPWYLLVVALPEVLSSEDALTTRMSRISKKVEHFRSVANTRPPERLLQMTVDELYQVCEDFIEVELSWDETLECSCTRLEDDEVELICEDTYCLYCDESLQVCGEPTYGIGFGAEGSPPDFIISESYHFQYTTGGRDETIAVNMECDYSSELPCNECQAIVNDEQCASCSVCDGYGLYDIDCSNLNLSSETIFDECDYSTFLDYGVFESLVFYSCFYDAPENDMCSGSTMLALDEPTMGTFQGATIDSINSDCGFGTDEGQGVWYTVVGTGSEILLSTCSYDTWVGTSATVYSGTCDQPQCVTADQSSCFGWVSGGRVSWKSEIDVLYHVHLINPDGWEDQFEILATNIPDANNRACATATQEVGLIDTSASTLDLAGTGFEEDSCGKVGTSGLWYDVAATEDGVMRASTCSTIDSFYTVISVMAGDCDALTCIAYGTSYDYLPGCGEGGTEVEWKATSGESYHIFVRGIDDYGTFQLSSHSLDTPQNDLCKDASSLSMEGVSVSGSTESATQDLIVGNQCSQETFYKVRRGVWYSFTGKGTFVRANVCSEGNSETQISIYSGDCSKSQCVAEGQYEYNESCPGGGYKATWRAENGVDYYLFLFSTNVQGGGFEVSLTEFTPPSNYVCDKGVGPLDLSGETIAGSTLDSIYDGTPDCSYKMLSPGLWYTVIGNGDIVRVDTCSQATQFDSQISIYRGDSCANLECMTYNDDSCGALTSAVQFPTEAGEKYYIKVHGHGYFTGNFELSVQSIPMAANNFCSSSTPVTPGTEVVKASTFGATYSEDAPPCVLDPSSTPGIWFTVQGRGKAITASTCLSSSTSSTSIAVYSGTCDDLVCITGGGYDYHCEDSLAGIASWYGEDGVDYYILVQADDGSGVDTGLSVTEFENVDNDFCQIASRVEVDGETVSGTITGATSVPIFPNATCIVYSETPSVWYYVEGDGSTIVASTCSEQFSYDWSLSILKGSCGDLECVADSGWEYCTVRFTATLGERYYILVQGTSIDQAGEFSLTLTSSEATENDLCSNAEVVDLSSSSAKTIVGTTIEATQDHSITDTCGTFSSGGDVWYQLVGHSSDSVLVATTCDPGNDFDTQLSVYKGDCSKLECVTTNDDFCGIDYTGSRVSWAAEEGTAYFIRVHGYDYSGGNFVLSITSETGTNGNCESPTEVEVSESSPLVLLTGTTVNADKPPLGLSPCGLFVDSSVVWFTITGVSGVVTASTCSTTGTVFDTVIEVFEGQCETLTCVTSNDDDVSDPSSMSSCSTVKWSAEEGKVYFIRLGGFAGAEGEFELVFSFIPSTEARGGD